MKKYNPKKYYVYAYLDPLKPGDFQYKNYYFSFEPFYIGKGSGKRSKMHMMQSRCFNNFLKHKINKIKDNGNTPIIIQFQDNLLEEEAYKLETDMINSIGKRITNTGPLTNLSDGGLGCTHYKYTKEQRERRSIQLLGEKNPMFGKKHPPEIIKKMSKERTGSLNANAKIYKITKENGTILNVKSLKTFCKERNLNYSTIRSAMLTKRWHSGFYFEQVIP